MPSPAGSIVLIDQNKELEGNVVYNPGDIAWVLACTALVWIMVPGVGFFYSGLLRCANCVLCVVYAHCMRIFQTEKRPLDDSSGYNDSRSRLLPSWHLPCSHVAPSHSSSYSGFFGVTRSPSATPGVPLSETCVSFILYHLHSGLTTIQNTLASKMCSRNHRLATPDSRLSSSASTNSCSRQSRKSLSPSWSTLPAVCN